MQQKKNGFIHVVVIFGILILVFLLVTSIFIGNKNKNKKINDERSLLNKITDTYPKCPKDISGILTYPMVDPKYISAVTPLGNINPPGHTSPVDHNYFSTNYEGKIPLYAPADSWITSITSIMKKEKNGEYKTKGYTLRYIICDGLELDQANFTEIIQPLKDIISQKKDECKYDINKPGHDYTEGQCYFQLSFKVKAGDEIGWVQREKRSDGLGYDLPYEIWAANYNKPPRSDVNWDYYKDDRYAHIMCTFDLYTKEIKDEYYKKFGAWEVPKYKDPKTAEITLGDGKFTPRVIEPLCGQVNQDIVGTIQGMWFGEKPYKDQSVEFEGKGLAFLHNNIDPTQGEISIGGDLMGGVARVIFFKPQTFGLVDREPNQVKADGQIYCYNFFDDSGSFSKIIVQLVDDHNLKAEHKIGECGQSEFFNSPFKYER